jgi:hypothetical protein
MSNKMIGMTTILAMHTSLSSSQNIPFSGIIPLFTIDALSCLGPSRSMSNNIKIVSRDGEFSKAIIMPATS